jgi:hypothetical protein
LPIEIRLDPTAAPSQLVEALAALLLDRARKEVLNEKEEMTSATLAGGRDRDQ